MATKVKPSKLRRDPVSFLPAVILVFILSLVSYVSQIILHPVYGSVGTHLHHYNVILTISTATSLLTFFGFDGRRLQSQTWKAIALILISAPLILPTLFRFSGRCGPVWGPILTQAVMTWPCVFFTSHDISRRALDAIGRPKFRSFSLQALLALSTGVPLIITLNISEQFLGRYFQPFIGVLWSRFSIFVYLGIFALFVDNLPINRSKFTNLVLVIAAVIPIALFVFSRPHVITGVNSGLLARLPSEYTYLDRWESITGMITVVENSQHGYRVLKCDHSILGGLWTGIKRKELSDRGVVGPELEKRSVDEAESVYSAFIVQEAVRLVTTPRKQDTALIMYFPYAFVDLAAWVLELLPSRSINLESTSLRWRLIRLFTSSLRVISGCQELMSFTRTVGSLLKNLQGSGISLSMMFSLGVVCQHISSQRKCGLQSKQFLRTMASSPWYFFHFH